VASAGWWWILPVVPRAVLNLPRAELMRPQILADGSTIAVAYAEQLSQDLPGYRLLIWNTRARTVIDLLPGHTVADYAFSPDGRWAVFGFQKEAETNPTMFIMDLSTQEMKPIPDSPARPKESCPYYKFVGTQPLLVVQNRLGSTQPLTAWRVPQLTAFHFPDSATGIASESWNGGKLVLCLDSPNGYLLWDPESGNLPRAVCTPYFSTPYLGTDHNSFFGYDSGVICGLGNCSGDVGCRSFQGKKLWEIKGVSLRPPVRENSLIPLQRWRGVAERGTWEFVDTATGKTARHFAFEKTESPRAFAPNGQLVAVRQSVESTEGTLNYWLRQLHLGGFTRPEVTERVKLVDIETGQIVFEQGLIGSAAEVQFTRANGLLIVEENKSHTLWFWDIPPRKSLTWFAAGAGLLALPIALVARRRVRRLRAT
jgi:hypothetical protein